MTDDPSSEDLDVSVADDGLVVRATIDPVDERNPLNEAAVDGGQLRAPTPY